MRLKPTAISNNHPPFRVISGGQTGVDRLALEIAREYGLPTGGTAPKGFRTEKGSDFALKSFGLVEDTTSNYSSRTRINVLASDATALFGDLSSSGSKATIGFCIGCGKPFIQNPTASGLIHFIRKHRITVLNIAGNRASRLNPWHRDFTCGTLHDAFAEISFRHC
jgi:Circularly permutated YpsA SLOG family